jgi:hypothetical protein
MSEEAIVDQGVQATPTNIPASAQAATSNAQAAEEPSEEVSISDLQRQIKELRQENAIHRKKAQEQTQAKKQAEEERLKALEEQGQFKELSETRGQRLKELEPIAEQYSKLSASIARQIKRDTENWPEEVKVFDPGVHASVEARLEWMEKSKPIVDRLNARAAIPGNNPNPKPAGARTPAEQEQKYIDELRASGRYGH